MFNKKGIGKTLNMSMLKYFFDVKNKDENSENFGLLENEVEFKYIG